MNDIAQTKDALVETSLEWQNGHNHWMLLKRMVQGGSRLSMADRMALITPPHQQDYQTLQPKLQGSRYENVIGSIVNKLRGQVMATDILPNHESNDEFWDAEFFKKGCFVKGKPASFIKLLSEACLSGFTQGKAYVVVDVNPDTRKPFAALVNRDSVLDESCEGGQLQFIKIVDSNIRKKSWRSDSEIVHTFSIYESIDGKYYQSQYNIYKNLEGEADYEFSAIGKAKGYQEEVLIQDREMYSKVMNGELFAPAPVIELDFEEGTWIADSLFDSQRSLFNQITGSEWALMSTNFAMLVFLDVMDEEDIKDRFDKVGDGYWFSLPKEVRAEWLTRDPRGIELSMNYASKLKMQMYEEVEVIIQNVAATVMARSGESKKEDRRHLEIFLRAIGRIMRDFGQQILDTVFIANGEDPTASLTGFENYDSDSLLEDLEEYRQSERIFRSKTYTVEGQKALSTKSAASIGIPAEKWKQIKEEIEANTVLLSEAQQEMIKDLVIAGQLPLEAGLRELKRSQLFGDDFNVEEVLIQLGIGEPEQIDLPPST